MSPGGGRRSAWLAWAGLLALILVYLALPAIVGVELLDTRVDRLFPDTESALDMAAEHVIGAVIAVLAISLRRWWHPVLHEDLRTRRWLLIVPLAILGTAAVFADYGRMATAGAAIVATVALAAVSVGISEELMFRGYVVTWLRQRYSEGAVAVLSSAVFALAHAPAGPVAALWSGLFGFLLYLARRLSGGLLLPVIMHASWDFVVFGAGLTDSPADRSYASLALALVTAALVAATGLMWRRIAAHPGSTTSPR